MARPIGSKNVKWDKEELQRLYWQERMSAHAIGQIYGVPQQCISAALRRLGIPRRNHSEATSGDLHYRWQGGRYKNLQGYIRVRAIDHPYADHRGYVLEHRLIVERKIRRHLLPSEMVHHLNGVYDDNRLGNLVVFSKKTHDNLIPALQKRIRLLEKQLRNRQQVMELS